MNITSRRVSLPDLEEGVRHRRAMLVQHMAGHDDSLAYRLLTGSGIAGQVGILRRDLTDCRPRAGELGEGERNLDERAGPARA